MFSLFNFSSSEEANKKPKQEERPNEAVVVKEPVDPAQLEKEQVYSSYRLFLVRNMKYKAS